MLQKFIFSVTAAAMLSALVTPTAVLAHDRHERWHDQDNDQYSDDNDGNWNGYPAAYGRQDSYDPRGDTGYNSYRDNSYGCKRSKGTAGLLIGVLSGGYIGHQIVGRRGDRVAGAIVGAGVGGLAGRAIDRAGSSCR